VLYRRTGEVGLVSPLDIAREDLPPDLRDGHLKAGLSQDIDREVKDAKDASSMSRLENCFSGAGIVRAERNVFDGLELRDDHVEFCADPAICVTPQNEPVHRQV